jgi:hypothetical protein
VSPFRRFDSIAALRGNGLRPELQALFERLAVESAFDTAVRPQPAYAERKGCSQRSAPKHTRTNPGFSQACSGYLHRKSTGFSTESSTGFPQFFHRLSTDSSPGK